MQKKYRVTFISFVAVVALLLGAFGASFASAQGQSHSAAQVSSTSASSAISKVVAQHTVKMSQVSGESSKAASSPVRAMPLLPQRSKAGAALNQNAPHFTGLTPTASDSISPNTPPTITKFHGMADSASICPYFGGCQPPDMALATSPKWVFQGVNTSFAVYNTSGAIQAGWPKNAQKFFGVPNPPNNCDPNGPFLSDPRAFYDPNDGRFWAATLQVEGAFGLNTCPFQTLYWIAVSQTNDPNGTWNVYAFDMSLGTTNAADYTQFGFDAHAIYFNANMFNQAGSAYAYDELFGANKAKMEAGQAVTAFGFDKLTANGVLVDTVQPVETEVLPNEQLGVGLFVNTFNMNGDGTHDCLNTACSGIVVWAMENPGTHSATLTGVIVKTLRYISPPNADQPGCTQCIETIDTRITATPVFSKGTISWSIDTGAKNKTQVVPTILWGQVSPQFVNGHLKGAFIYQSNYFGFEGDQDASFGAMMPDNNGDLIMVYDTMSSTLNPSTAYTGRRVTYPLGFFHDAGKFLQKGLAPTFDSRWGDYEATSYDGFSTDHIWMASQYSGANSDWATVIGKTKFLLK
ncbi:MAG: hypothetical protein M3Y76_09075 [Chloroflexota bacterium]|nr:hypothetical protein [Chloroflexota bacterium]